jgi:hypothetical protein
MLDLKSIVNNLKLESVCCYYFIKPVIFDTTANNWYTKKKNNKYYLYVDDALFTFNYYSRTYPTFLSTMAVINNNKNLALLNIRNFDTLFGKKVIEEILKGNKIYVEEIGL